jgi:predicted ATPase
MELQLKNIGMIKEANVKIDGLTVIAGENDTGKSTVAKALHYEALSYDSMGIFPIPLNRASLTFGENENAKGAILIDTPNSLDTFSFIKNATMLIHQQRLNIHLPLFRTDLILRLSQDISEDLLKGKIYKDIENLIDGKVFYNKSKDEILYEKYSLDNQIFKMENTSNGIKMFGFLQILLLNGTIKRDTILILDEPEVHLHPKWQLKYALFIVELVKSGVRVLVNSHSPYMIEALEVYASKKKINSNFYLAEKKDNYSTIIDVTSNLEPIYSKLAKPIQILEEESLENFKW